jgi:phosphoglycolate phosphatase-like HAD superfamily hydrolase
MTTRPLLVFDLDGTLAETAGDLIGTLNVILAREGVAPLPLAEARFMLGAGARALIQRGLAAVGRSVSPERLEEMFPRLSSSITRGGSRRRAICFPASRRRWTGSRRPAGASPSAPTRWSTPP